MGQIIEMQGTVFVENRLATAALFLTGFPLIPRRGGSAWCACDKREACHNNKRRSGVNLVERHGTLVVLSVDLIGVRRLA